MDVFRRNCLEYEKLLDKAKNNWSENYQISKDVKSINKGETKFYKIV